MSYTSLKFSLYFRTLPNKNFCVTYLIQTCFQRHIIVDMFSFRLEQYSKDEKSVLTEFKFLLSLHMKRNLRIPKKIITFPWQFFFFF
jgi:hypothetical protein